MSKKRRGKQKSPNIPPITGLRRRLDAQFRREGWAERDDEALRAALDAAFEGLKADEALPVLVRARQQAPERVGQRLDKVIPGWLDARGYRDTLLALLEQDAIYAEGQPVATTWLQEAGVAPGALEEIQEEPSLFYAAYAYDDTSQGVVFVFWYTDRRRIRVCGMNFLIDHNPPWEGAVKDITVLPTRTPEAATEGVHLFHQRGMAVLEVDPTEAKDAILRALQANRQESIRLPQDLVLAREMFLEHVLTLPDGPETPSFSAQDFDALTQQDRLAEALRVEEQLFGRRMRLEDGSEMVFLGDPLDEDDYDEDDWE